MGNKNAWVILGGVVVGVGAVAAAPFTGGGSLFAAGVSLGCPPSACSPHYKQIKIVYIA